MYTAVLEHAHRTLGTFVRSLRPIAACHAQARDDGGAGLRNTVTARRTDGGITRISPAAPNSDWLMITSDGM